MGYNRIETSKFLNLLILEAFFSITFITRAVFYLKIYIAGILLYCHSENTYSRLSMARTHLGL